jgi:rod shape-determining protein MreD
MIGGARPLDPWRWLGVPMLQALAAVVVFAAPIRVFGLSLPEPIFPMAAAFAWAAIRPSVLAPFGVLAMGLVCDLLWGAPMGLWASCLLLAYGLVLAGRSMIAGQGPAFLWAWYGAVSAVALLAAYLATMLDTQTMPNIGAVVWQLLVTILLYPFAHRLIEKFEDADVRFR